MADETHKLQKDPPEGSRKVVDNELERRAGKSGESQDRDGSAPSKRPDREAGRGTDRPDG